MQPQTITGFLNQRILEIDNNLSSDFASIAKDAAGGIGSLSGLQTNLEYIENGLVQKGMLEDILAGIKGGYIIMDVPPDHAG